MVCKLRWCKSLYGLGFLFHLISRNNVVYKIVLKFSYYKIKKLKEILKCKLFRLSDLNCIKQEKWSNSNNQARYFAISDFLSLFQKVSVPRNLCFVTKLFVKNDDDDIFIYFCLCDGCLNSSNKSRAFPAQGFILLIKVFSS